LAEILCVGVKVHLSLWYIKIPRHDDICGSGSMASLICNLGARWRWMVSLTIRPLYPWGKRPPGTHWIGWTSEPDWMLRRKATYVACFGSRTTIRGFRTVQSSQYRDWTTHTQCATEWPEDSSKLGKFCLITLSNRHLLQGKRSLGGGAGIFCVCFRHVRKIAGSDS
jgi:hypothetical protein